MPKTGGTIISTNKIKSVPCGKVDSKRIKIVTDTSNPSNMTNLRIVFHNRSSTVIKINSNDKY